MRTPLILASALVLAVASVPLAAASHVGPCTHEYVDTAIGTVVIYRQTGSFREALGYAGGNVGGCVDNLLAVCDYTTICFSVNCVIAGVNWCDLIQTSA